MPYAQSRAAYLDTFMLVPDDVVRVADTLPLNVMAPSRCYCGRIAHATVAAQTGEATDDVQYGSPEWNGTLVVLDRVYGDREAWETIFGDATGRPYDRDIAAAWNDRVAMLAPV